MAFEHITVQIMAGGSSRRMDRDTALDALGGKTLLQQAMDTWQGWGDALFLSVGDEERDSLTTVPGITAVFDRYPGCGPLGGLHGGLAACRSDYLLLCPVDAPYFTPQAAQALVDAIGESDACVFSLNGETLPLFGLYRATCLSMAQTLLMQGDLRMSELLEMVHTVTVPIEDAAAFRSLSAAQG